MLSLLISSILEKCLLNVYDLSKYWYTEYSNISITKDTYIDHEVNVSTQCKNKDGYILTNRQGLTSVSSKTAQCLFGELRNAYSCTFSKIL